MYTRFYGLSERPFELNIDPRYLYLSSRHRDALAHLTYAVEERRGFVQLTGDIGTGKTMMLDSLVQGLDAGTKVARISHTTITENELFDALIAEFGLESKSEKKLARLAEIQSFLDERTAAGRNAVLVVDEAQNLSLPVLEEIRLLSNLRSQGKCCLQIVLAGQPEFREKLELPELRQLKQRIGIRYHLTPLSRSETGEYIQHRMSVAGAQAAVFEARALEEVHRYTGGVPRMINVVCDRALLAGYAANAHRIGPRLVAETIRDVEGRSDDRRETAVPTWGTETHVPPEDHADVGAPVDASESPLRVGAPVDALRPEVVQIQDAAASQVAPAVRKRAARTAAWMAPAAIALLALAAVFLVGEKQQWWSWMPGFREATQAESAGPARAFAAETPDLPAFVTSDDAETPATPVAGVSAAPASRSERLPVDNALLEKAEEGHGGPEDVEHVRAVPDAPSGTPTVGPRRSGPGGPFRAYALSSRDRTASEHEAAAICDAGFDTEVISVALGEGDTWYRIAIVGGYPTAEDAGRAVEELRALGYAEAWAGRQ